MYSLNTGLLFPGLTEASSVASFSPAIWPALLGPPQCALSDAQKKREKILKSLSLLQRADPTPSDARKMESGATSCAGANLCCGERESSDREGSVQQLLAVK